VVLVSRFGFRDLLFVSAALFVSMIFAIGLGVVNSYGSFGGLLGTKLGFYKKLFGFCSFFCRGLWFKELWCLLDINFEIMVFLFVYLF